MVVVMVDVVVLAASAVAVAIPPSPTTATTLPSCRCHRCYSAAKTKALDDYDNNIDDNKQGIVVVVVIVVIAASAATIAFTVPVTFAVAVAVAVAVAIVIIVIIAVNRQWPPIYLIVVSCRGLVVMVLLSWSCHRGLVVIAIVIIAVVSVVVSNTFVVTVVIDRHCHHCLHCHSLLSPLWRRSNGGTAMGAAMAEKVVAQQWQWRCSNGDGSAATA
jgi:hypothetical protein